jgi:hypothetical protein
MRKHRLLTATALTLTMGLVALAGANGQANAATTISTATTAPVKTSTTGDLTVSSAGTITLTSGTAITVDSDNAVDFGGTITMSSSANNATGILITDVPNRTKGLTLTGDITVTDDYTATDTGSLDSTGAVTTTVDGIIDAPWATGTGRYGIHSTGASSFVGNVNITSASTIDVEGNASYGIRFENNIKGAFTYDGAMTLIGDNSTGISLEKGITGNVYLSGSINVLGENASAIKLTGDLGGSLIIDGTYTGTGYSSTSALTQAVYADLLPGKNLLQDGPLVSIASNVANGVLFGKAVTSTVDTNDDEDGDGLTDSVQTTASITQYGSAPALLVGSTTGNITLGGLTYASTAISPPSVKYGLLIRGSIVGSGVHPEVTSNAVQIGGTGHSVTIANGLGVYGTIQSTAYGANTTALSLLSGASTPRLDVNGTISATTTRYLTASSDTVPVYATKQGTAYAVDIASGATLPAINIAASSGITATGSGSTSSATAIRDQSNTLTTLTNSGALSAGITASDDNADGTAETITGNAIAIDTRSNTVGLTITQVDNNATDSDADTAIAAPYIIGQILLGAGDDSISSNGGLISGNVDFGGGANSFLLDGAATYLGKMTGSGTVNLNLDDGKMYLATGSALNLTALHVGAASTLGLTLDTDHPTTPIFTNSGSAIFDDGATVQLTVNKLIVNPTTFTLMTASSIDLGTLSTASLDGQVPYIYHADLTTNAGNTTLFANFRLKSQAEAQYSDNQYAALAPVLSVVSQDTGATSSLLSQLTKSGFDEIYNQYLPDYSGENLLGLATGASAMNRTLSSLTLVPDNNEGQWWLQEYGYQVKRDYGETAGFKATAFSFAGGREREVYGNQMLGVYMSYTSASPLDTFAIAGEKMVNSDVTLGGYWRIRTGAMKAWAHAGAGYTSFETTRNILTTAVDHVATAKWNGYSYSGGAGASYEVKTGRISFTPQVLTDYYALNESDHTETGGGDYYDLTIGDRDSHLLTASALLNVSYTKSFIKPEVWVGYKQNVSAEIADTVANFKDATPFTLTGGDIEGGGPVAGFRVSVDNQYSFFSLEGEYEKKDAYTNFSMSLRTRFQF